MDEVTLILAMIVFLLSLHNYMRARKLDKRIEKNLAKIIKLRSGKEHDK